jgi:hypothetical protein
LAALQQTAFLKVSRLQRVKDIAGEVMQKTHNRDFSCSSTLRGFRRNGGNPAFRAKSLSVNDFVLFRWPLQISEFLNV